MKKTKRIFSLLLACAMLVIGLNIQVFAEGEEVSDFYFNYDPYRTAGNIHDSVRATKDKITVVVGDKFDLRITSRGRFTNSTFPKLRWMPSKPGVISIYTTSDTEPNAGCTAIGPGEITLTVKAEDGSASCSIDINVLEKDPEQERTGSFTFAKSGYSHEVSDGIAGINVCVNPSSEDTQKVLTHLNTKSYRTNSLYVNGANVGPGETKYGDAYYKVANDLKIPAVFNFYSKIPIYGEYEKAVETMKQMVEEAKAGNEYEELYIEMFNEIYDSSGRKNEFPTSDSYIELCKMSIPELKKIAPDAYYIVCGYDPSTHLTISSNGETWFSPPKETEEQNLAERLAHWDEKVRELIREGYCNAATIHVYESAGTQVTGETDENYMRIKLVLSDASYFDTMWASKYFGDVPLFITEWGQLQAAVYFGIGNDAAEKARITSQKYPAAALFNAKTMLGFMATGVVEQAHLHASHTVDGLGIMETANDPQDTPMTIMFKRMTKLVEDTDYYYEILPEDMTYTTINYPWIEQGDRYELGYVQGWGFGDKDKMTQAAFINQTDVPQKIKIEGTKIKPNWSYGNDLDHMVPEFMHNQSYMGSHYTQTFDLENASVYLFPANNHEDAKYEEEVIIPPYTLMIVDVENDPAIVESTSSAVSRLSNFHFRNAVILNVGNSVAYVDNIKKTIDENPGVTPIIENGRTLLPLRFVAESLGCSVDYDAATKGITIKNFYGTHEIKFTVGDAKYTVDGEELELDVAPTVKNDRTLLPIRALAEALGKDVHWDNRGYIFLASKTPRINGNTEYYFEEINKLYE